MLLVSAIQSTCASTAEFRWHGSRFEMYFLGLYNWTWKIPRVETYLCWHLVVPSIVQSLLAMRLSLWLVAACWQTIQSPRAVEE